MGREVRRVPAGFDWPVNEQWWGFCMDAVACRTCGGTGLVGYPNGWQSEPDENGRYYCPTDCHEGRAFPRIDVPEGGWYQVWETVSEGSPITPAFETPEEVARWISTPGNCSWMGADAGYDVWLKFIRGPGWAPSMIATNGVVQDGVSAMVAMEDAKP